MALCLQVEMISALEFRVLVGSANAMTIFSVRHKSQRLVPHLYGEARLAILHDKLNSTFLSFNVHKYFERAVSVLKLGVRNDLIWLLYRVLNGPSVKAIVMHITGVITGNSCLVYNTFC